MPSSQPIPSFYNGVCWASWGTIGSPVLLSCEQSMSCPYCLGKSLFRFFSFFPSLSSDPFESFWLAIFFGSAEVCPSRHPHFWRLLLFRFFPIWVESCSALLKSFCYHSSSLSWFPDASSVCAMKGRLRSFVFLFSFFLSSFYRSVLVFFFFALIDGAWGSLLLILCCDLLSFFFGCFSFSGLRDPQGLSYNPFGLGLSFFLLGLTHSFWA